MIGSNFTFFSGDEATDDHMGNQFFDLAGSAQRDLSPAQTFACHSSAFQMDSYAHYEPPMMLDNLYVEQNVYVSPCSYPTLILTSSLQPGAGRC